MEPVRFPRKMLGVGIVRHLLPLVLVLNLVRPARPDWVDTVFPDRMHDFGKVARGSKLKYAFPVVNKTDRAVRIVNWQTKCGCTEVKVGSMTVPPGSQTFVEATLDTTKFQGDKSSGLTLQLDQPSAATVELGLRCYIEPALILTPGLVDFGSILRTSKPQVSLLLSYSGAMKDWRVIEMKTISGALTARLEEVGKTSSGGPQYRLTASLDPQALRDGRFKDEIILVTNDPQMARIPVSVTGKVQSTVSASPAVVDLGTLKPGQTAQKTVLLRASTPFQIKQTEVIQGEVTVPPTSLESKTLHVVNLVFKAPAHPGAAHAIVELKTSVAGEPPVRVTAFTNVVP